MSEISLLIQRKQRCSPFLYFFVQLVPQWFDFFVHIKIFFLGVRSSLLQQTFVRIRRWAKLTITFLPVQRHFPGFFLVFSSFENFPLLRWSTKQSIFEFQFPSSGVSFVIWNMILFVTISFLFSIDCRSTVDKNKSVHIVLMGLFKNCCNFHWSNKLVF